MVHFQEYLAWGLFFVAFVFKWAAVIMAKGFVPLSETDHKKSWKN